MHFNGSHAAGILVLSISAFLGGCAHNQAPSTTTSRTVTATPPSPAKAEKAAPKQDPMAQQSEDLEAFLRGTVVHFDFNAYRLTAESQERLQKLADLLRAHRSAKILVSGNCDDRGTEEYNLALGEERAQIAKKYLVDLGIAANRIETVTYGEDRPVDNRDNEEAWAANRRDEFATTKGF